MILTEKEYVALDKVAVASKMDCWFLSVRRMKTTMSMTLKTAAEWN